MKQSDITDNLLLPPDNYVMIWDKHSGRFISERNWLEHAIPLDVYASASPRLKTLVDKIFSEVSKSIKISNMARTKEALKTIITNLWLGKQIDAPINYSRNKNKWVRNSRYGKLYFTYKRFIPVIDALEDLGYIHQKRGIYNIDKDFGRETRMWGTYKLWHNFTTFGLYTPTFFNKPRPEELIILKDNNKDKTKIGYRETKHIQQWREDLIKYNNYLKQHKIYVKLIGENIVDNRFILHYLFSNILKSKIIIQIVILNNNITRYKKYPLLQYYNNKYITNNIQPTMTNTFSSNRMVDKGLQHICGRSFLEYWFLPQLKSEFRKCESKEERNDFLSVEHVLEGLGFERIIFRLNYEYLHRVFSRKSFKKGGRAYGALHQNLPKHMRQHIYINGEKTTEIDYSAYHIRMLYHMEGIDYTEDPYLVCGGPDLRETYKAVGLIAINAENDKSAYGAIRDELEARGIPLPKIDKPLVALVNTFRDAHKPISKYLFSDIGITLQNIDGEIMNNILMRLMDKGILGLSVFDSVIVAEQYADILREIMVAEYEKVMKFKPMF
ncbi:MAG: hypothetical protein SRB2_04840 [Desulfobacteraceae bacterium Eth-SRB2]|nr:MAG: hypothetical protein SRB2_04840 [Desulfobacteraceae bacterium Eth-SRB2]